ncbi:MAG: hypothetical protein ACRD2L_10515, partial [Terriglobia bacterium]
LKAAFDENNQQRRTLTHRLDFLKARIRITAILVYISQEKCRCPVVPSETAKACWDKCFDNVNPRLKSCLDIDDPNELRLCLIRARHR